MVKHAAATAVDVRFSTGTDGGGLVVEVTDDGTGIGDTPCDDSGDSPADTAGDTQPDRPGVRWDGLGLVSMRERTQRWGGRLEAGPRPRGGWTVRVALPGPGTPAVPAGEEGRR